MKLPAWLVVSGGSHTACELERMVELPGALEGARLQGQGAMLSTPPEGAYSRFPAARPFPQS